MFTGIVESLGLIADLKKEQNNLTITVRCNFTNELKVDQSVLHNGICLTVVKILDTGKYVVTAIEETLSKTNLLQLKREDAVNLERAMQLNARIDGHLVQGHVDTTAVCKQIKDEHGSKLFTFSFSEPSNYPVINQGSICVNGISLTVVEAHNNEFSVAIIPYTLENTNFKFLQTGDAVNIEFDMIGKYVLKILKNTLKQV